MAVIPMQNHSSLGMMGALSLWREILLQLLQKNNAYNLSNRQTLILMTVYLLPPPHTVKNLSFALAISKPAICRALDALSKNGMLRRKRDERDKRQVNVQRTVKGSVFLSEFAEIIDKLSKHTTNSRINHEQ